MEVFNVDEFNKYFNKNLVIEASAGTGKTYSITKIISNLVKNGIDIKKVLIVTFTEKATGELKDRIRKELLNIVKDKNDLDNLNIYTIHSFCQNAIKEFGLEANLVLNLNVMDEVTLANSFFDKYLRDTKILSDIDYLIEENSFGYDFDEASLKRLFIEVLLKYYLNKDNEINSDIISLDLDDSLSIYEDLKEIGEISFNNLCNKNKEFKYYFDIFNESSDVSLKLFSKIIKDNLDKKNLDIKTTLRFDSLDDWDLTEEEKEAVIYFNNFDKKKKYDYSSFEDFLDDNDTFSNYLDILKKSKDLKCITWGNSITGKPKKREGTIDINIPTYISMKSKKGYPEKDIEVEAMNYLSSYIDKLKGCNIYVALVNKYINDFYISFGKEKKLCQIQTFNDMLKVVKETLDSNSSFKNALKNKYCYAIIDEFQDTNQLQFDTFKSIFLEDNNHHLIVVGDPKQSIYSFQGADLSVYFKAKEEIDKLGGYISNLATNYRSSSKMIESCNKLFMKYNDESFFHDIEFMPSKSPNNKKDYYIDGNIGKAIILCNELYNIDLSKLSKEEYTAYNDYVNKSDLKALEVLKSSNNKECLDFVNNSIDISPKNFAKLAVMMISDYCMKKNGKTKLQLKDKEGNFRNVSFKDFTILARTRTEMDIFTKEAKKCGIPFIKYKDTGLFQTRECYHFIALLEAINKDDFTGYKRKAFNKALFTEFFGNDLEDINKDYFSHDDINEFYLMNKWKCLKDNRKWEDLIDSILIDSKLLDRLNSLDKLQSLTVFRQLGDFSISYLYDNHTLDDLIGKLKGIDDLDEDSSVVEIGTDYDAVKLMTIHASKGLQFPVVISLAGFKGPINSKTYIYHKDNKRKISFESSDITKEEALKEFERLMYVCFTRAEYLMILPNYIESKTNIYNKFLRDRIRLYKDNNIGDYDIKIFNSINYDEIKKNVSLILNEKKETDDFSKQEKKINKLIKQIPSIISYKHSYSSLSHPKEKEELIEDELVDKEGMIDVSISDFDLNNIVIEGLYNKELTYTPYDDIPRGASIGSLMHEIFENIDFTNYEDKIDNLIIDLLKKYSIKLSDRLINYLKEMTFNVLNAKLVEIKGNKAYGTFKLNSIDSNSKLAEAEFNFNIKNDLFKNYLNGFIDLLFKRDEYYSILDWKSDTLNDDEFISYSDIESLRKHTSDRYSIQRVLYSYCLINWLSNFYNETKEEIFNNHFGGIYYVYLRGCNKDTSNGVYQQTWSSYSDLEKAFNEIVKEKVRG